MYICPFLPPPTSGLIEAITDMGTCPKMTVTCVDISGILPIYSVLLLLLVVKGKCDDASEAKKNQKTDFKRHAYYLQTLQFLSLS